MFEVYHRVGLGEFEQHERPGVRGGPPGGGGDDAEFDVVPLGDLVQEGNMGLMLAMEDHADDTEALLSMAKESMQALLESQEETKKQDNRMVEKVNDLDEQIKKLSDELGRKVSVDELEEFAGITEDEISDILKLAGEELPPEEK